MKKKLFVLSLAAALSACGGGSSDNVDKMTGGGSGGGGNEPEGPSEYEAIKQMVLAEQGQFDDIAQPGLYSIELTNEATGVVSKGTSLVASSGRILSYFDDFLAYQYIGNHASEWRGGFGVTSNRIDVGDVVWGTNPNKLGHDLPNSEVTATVTGSGNLEDHRYRIFQGPQNHEVAISDIAGEYYQSDTDGYEMTLKINADGVIQGNDTSGCQYQGEILATPEDSHTFEGVLDVSECTQDIAGDFPASYKNGVYIFQGFYKREQGSFNIFPQKQTAGSEMVFDIILINRLGQPSQDVDQAFSSGYISDDFTVVNSVMEYMPVGLFQNTTYSVSGETVSVNGTGFGIISPTGRMVFANTEFSGYTRIEVEGSGTYTAPMIVAPPVSINSVLIDEIPRILDGFPTEAVVIDGSHVETGTLEYRVGISPVELDVDAIESGPDYEGGPLELGDINGVYVSTDGSNPNRQFRINGSTITGLDDGCTINGELVRPVAGLDIYEAQLVATECTPNENAAAAERLGTYQAVLSFSRVSDLNKTDELSAAPIMRMVYTNDIVNAAFTGSM